MRRPGGWAESAARKERLRLAEAQGELEESAARMVRASLAYLDTEQDLPLSPLPTSQPCIPIASRLGPLPEKTIASSLRMPILDRLGPLLDEVTTEESAIPPQPQKRKPGRPPGKRRVNASPLALLGTSAKRRTGQHTKPPTCRKKLSVEADPRGKVTKARKCLNIVKTDQRRGTLFFTAGIALKTLRQISKLDLTEKTQNYLSLNELLETVQRKLEAANVDNISVESLISLEEQFKTALSLTRARKTELMMQLVKTLQEKVSALVFICRPGYCRLRF
ncbi:hypothetical protein F2Q69_00001142 [Brassica cretica]|uniref:K-box domain-containing protein n=1 Tax=Brassica cretica TaxID=69181 RepID=A0A8S9PG57_BRACR|nr:hypothetical protein F2Q69_00001142 [Brassica cretica]